MFFKNSRYRFLKDQVVTDKEGNDVMEKELRLLPFAEGKYLHTLNEGDRLDHLAHKFYQQSKKWWRICDANPAHLSPLGLMGKEPVSFSRFIVTYEEEPIPEPEGKSAVAWVPPLGLVREHLRTVTGITEVFLMMNAVQEKYTETKKGIREKRIWGVDVSYNRLTIKKEDIKKEIESCMFIVNEIMDIKPFGKKIIIPENTVE